MYDIFGADANSLYLFFAFNYKFYSFVFLYYLTFMNAKTHLYQYKVRLFYVLTCSINYELCM